MPTVQAQGIVLSQAESSGDVQARSEAAARHSDSAGAGDLLGVIHNLPLEVLSKIFLLVLPTDLELHKKSHMLLDQRSRLINPFLLCSICSAWRTLALTTLQLWRRVFIHISSQTPITNDIGHSKADDLSQWIQRSGSLPLTLYFTYDAYIEPVRLDETGPIAPIVDVLTRYAARWEAFYLQSPVHDEWTFNPLPNLFCLDGWSSLRRVSLHEIDRGDKTTIPWAQLTHLEVGLTFFFELVVDTLRECQELTWLSISVYQAELSGPPLVFPNLVTLHLTTYHDLVVVMNSISLPSLREMFISRVIPDEEDEVESLLGFLTRSACALDKLEIGEDIFTEGNLVHVLAHQCCNSLTSLTINGRFVSRYNIIEDEFFERLSLYHEKPLCPHLRFLKLEHCQVGCSAALLGMVKSRIEFPAGDGRFHFLCLEMKHFAHGQELEEIIKGSGMDYTLRREPENSVTEYKVWLDGRMCIPDSIQFE